MTEQATVAADKSLRVGVVGVGVMGSNHARVFADLSGVTLVGIVDPEPKQRDFVTGALGCQGFPDLDSLLDAGVDKFLVTRHDFDEFPERPFQFVQHPSNFALSGRGGIVSNAPDSLTLPCYAPSEMMIVRANGDVTLCHEDALGEVVLGNLERESLECVWFSERARKLRALLEQGHRAVAGGPCTFCDCRLHPLRGGAI